MTNPAFARARLVRAALLGATALTLYGTPFAIGEAAAKVGVTSAADGDPLGKPPNENERVLRIGIDIQANELVTTSAKDRAHLVFLDGSSLTVGPDARLTIDKFVFDPSTKTGELAISASKGVFRLVGGKISKTAPITITTPSGSIGIRGGITIFSVTQTQTTATFVFGNSMTVTSNGQTQTATRPGSQIISSAGGAPSAPAMVKQGGLNAALGQLEGTSGTSGSGNSADQTAQRSGFSSVNSGQPANLTNLGQNNPPNPNNNTVTTVISNTTVNTQPGESTPTNPVKTSSSSPTPNPNPNPNPTVNPIPNPIPGPQPQVIVIGQTRTTQTLTGYVGGLLDTKRGNSYETKVPIALFSKLGDVTISTDAATNQASGKIVLRGYDGSLVSFPELTLQLGGGSSKLEKNGQTYQVEDHTVLASSQAAAVTLPGNPTLCTCAYLTWGWWSTDTTVKSGPNAGDKIGVNMGTYVAGQPTTAIQMPQTGSATYTGFMVGNVKNGINSYIGSGNYMMNYNYGARLGGTSMQFDNRSYGGVVAGTNSSGTNFAGAFTGGGRVGSMSGSFYGPDAANQGGAFSIGTNSSNYKASGIFAGQK